MGAKASEGDFTALFEQTSRRVYAFARRQADPAIAEEVVGEVYLAAWRHHAELPDDPLPWLLVAARNVLRNHWRSRDRQQRLSAELAGLAQLATPPPDHVVIDRDTMVRALSTLSQAERETLLLVAWDGLDRSAAAIVAGCSPAAFSVRLHRARQAFNRALGPEPAEQEVAATLIPLHPLEETS